jgi:hypothetical protein
VVGEGKAMPAIQPVQQKNPPPAPRATAVELFLDTPRS